MNETNQNGIKRARPEGLSVAQIRSAGWDSGPYGYIRKTYGVPARTGGRIRYTGDKSGPKDGAILRQYGPQSHLAVRFDDEKRTAYLHPTWEVEYL